MQSRTYRFLPLFTLWFGASISVAEMQTGGLMAPAGLSTGILAIAGGHLLGALLLGLMGYLGFREGTPAIMCTRISFGLKGSWLLSLANTIQLLGWTAVMLRFSGQAVSSILLTAWGLDNTRVYAVVFIGCLVALWSFWETQGQHWGNMTAVGLLLCLALLVSWVLSQKAGGPLPPAAAPEQAMSFGGAFELSLVMPLSWVPLVADYSSRAKSARIAFLAPSVGYCLGSVWMYSLGFAGALLTGQSDPVPMLLAAGFGVAALSIVALSTVCTTFLDVYSTIMTARNVYPALPAKSAVPVVVCLGIALALVLDSKLYMHFLEMIGAFFAPLSAILFSDYFLMRNDSRNRPVDITGLASLLAGIASHSAFGYWNSPLGPTLSCLLFTLALHIALRRISAARLRVPPAQGSHPRMK